MKDIKFKEYKEVLKIIGGTFRRVRQENNLTVREIADIIGVTQNTICNFERGESNNLILFIAYWYLFNIEIGDKINENK